MEHLQEILSSAVARKSETEYGKEALPTVPN